MQQEPTNPLVKEVPGHLFQFEEKIWGMTLQQLLTDLGVLTGSITLTRTLPLVSRIMVCALLTLLTLLLIHSKVQGHPLSFWCYWYLRSKMMPAQATWQARGTPAPFQKRGQGKHCPSVQAAWIPVDSLEQGIMGKYEQQNERAIPRYWTVFEVQGRNVRLLAEQEQIRIFHRFEAFLTGLEFHVQFLSYTEQIDPQTAPALLAQKQAWASLSTTPRLQALQQASILAQEQQMTTCIRTRHFVVVSASGVEACLHHPDGTPRSALSLLWQHLFRGRPSAMMQAQVLDQLRTRASVVKKALSQLDIHVLPLEDAELLQVFARTLAPGACVPTFVPEVVEDLAPSAPLQRAQEEAREKAGTQALHEPPLAAPTSASWVRPPFPWAEPVSIPGVSMAGKPHQRTRKDYKKRLRGFHGIFSYRSTHAHARLDTGVIDLADLLAPSRVEVRPDRLEIQAGREHRYVRAFTITGYGHHLLCGWVSELTDLGLPMLISLHFEPIDARLMVMQLEQHLTRLESKRLADQKTLRLPRADQSIEAEQIRHVSRALASKQLKILDVSMTICLHAGSLERLEQRSRYLLSHLHDLHIQAHPPILQQDLAWQSCLPVNLDRLQYWVKLPSDVGSTLLTGASGVVGTPTGVFLGYTGGSSSHRPVYLDPWKLPNPHIVVIGETGQGKSWLVKVMVTGLLGLALADVIVLDRDDDYLPLHQELGGESQRYNLARRCPINLFDLPFGPHDVDPADPTDMLAEFFDNQLLTGLALLVTDEETRLSKGEEAYLLQVARATYAARGITDEALRFDPQTLLLPAPTLADFIEMMQQTPASSESMRQSLLERLFKAAYLFHAGQTSVSLDTPLTIFSIKDLDEKWYALMTYVVQSFLMRHRALKRHDRYLAYVVEEASYLLKHPAGRRYLESGARGFRKLGIAQMTLSQHPRDFLEAGQVVLSNAGTAFFLGMQRQAAEKLHLPEELERVLVEGIPGQCVMRIGNEYAPLSVWTNPIYKTIFTTDPAERKALQRHNRAHQRQR